MKILKKIICICLVAILAAGLFPGAQTEVYAAGKPVQLVSCKVNSVGSKVTVKAKVAGIQKGMGKKRAGKDLRKTYLSQIWSRASDKSWIMS